MQLRKCYFYCSSGQAVSSMAIARCVSSTKVKLIWLLCSRREKINDHQKDPHYSESLEYSRITISCVSLNWVLFTSCSFSTLSPFRLISCSLNNVSLSVSMSSCVQLINRSFRVKQMLIGLMCSSVSLHCKVILSLASRETIDPISPEHM